LAIASRLNPYVLDRVYLPKPIFLTHDRQSPYFVPGRNACLPDVEDLNHGYGYTWPDEPQFFDRMAPGLVVKWATRWVKSGDQFGEVLTTLVVVVPRDPLKTVRVRITPLFRHDAGRHS
jgi:hypothetical protein